MILHWLKLIIEHLLRDSHVPDPLHLIPPLQNPATRAPEGTNLKALYKQTDQAHKYQTATCNYCAFPCSHWRKLYSTNGVERLNAEIKLCAPQIDATVANFQKIQRFIEKEGGKTPSVLCVSCGLTDFAYPREDGAYVVSITGLKN